MKKILFLLLISISSYSQISYNKTIYCENKDECVSFNENTFLTFTLEKYSILSIKKDRIDYFFQIKSIKEEKNVIILELVNKNGKIFTGILNSIYFSLISGTTILIYTND